MKTRAALAAKCFANPRNGGGLAASARSAYYGEATANIFCYGVGIRGRRRLPDTHLGRLLRGEF